MPGDDLAITGGITQALIEALNRIHTSIAARFATDTSAMYMHLPIGQPVDPRMYANPWTPAGGGVASTGGGAFTAPAPTAGQTPTTPATQAAAVQADTAASTRQALTAAYLTAQRVDAMLVITRGGIAESWPQKTVSNSYATVLAGMQATPVPDPPADVTRRIDEATTTLYTLDENGGFTGYTPRHLSYRHNRKALDDARSEYALAYAQAAADPAAGQAWPVTSAEYQNAVDSAYDDLRAMGAQEIEDAFATLQSVGGSAAAALIAKARRLYDDYSVGLGGAIATTVPWSYIDPMSWWDHTANDFGVMKLTASSTQYRAGGGGGEHSYGHSFYRDSSSSTSGEVGVDALFWGGSASASHSSTEHRDGRDTDTSSWTRHEDTSSSATVSLEYFVAEIMRPWMLGDLFHTDGWYLVGHPRDSISDGTVDGQLGRSPKLLPMIPKAFVVVRNVSITADSWGSMGDSFRAASSSSSGATDTSATSFSGSVNYLIVDGSVRHDSSTSSGAFTDRSESSSGWSFSSAGTGGTLTLSGAQIVGWIGQIQPACPRIDAPAAEPQPTEPQPAPAGPVTG